MQKGNRGSHDSEMNALITSLCPKFYTKQFSLSKRSNSPPLHFPKVPRSPTFLYKPEISSFSEVFFSFTFPKGLFNS